MLSALKILVNSLAALRKHVTLALLLIALAAVALLARDYFTSRADRAQLAATLAAAQKTIDAATQSQSARDAQLNTTLAQITAAKEKVQTPAQAATAIEQDIPQIVAAQQKSADAPASPKPQPGDGGTMPSTPISIALSTTQSQPRQGTASTENLPSAASRSIFSALKSALEGKSATDGSSKHSASQSSDTQSSAGAAQATPPSSSATAGAAPPSSAPTATIALPQSALKPLADAIDDCQACAAKLSAAQGDLSDETSKYNAAVSQRDAAVKAARGTFWSRVRKAAEYLAIGAAAGAVVTLAAKK